MCGMTGEQWKAEMGTEQAGDIKGEGRREEEEEEEVGEVEDEGQGWEMMGWEGLRLRFGE